MAEYDVSGSIYLPDDVNAPGEGISGSIVVSGSDDVGFTIPSGENSVAYSITLPIGNHEIGFTTSETEYVETGYYSVNGEGATSIEVLGYNVDGIDMTMIQK